MGGDRHSHRVEAHAGKTQDLIDEKPDVTLAEIAAHLEEVRDARFSEAAFWRLLKHHGMTRKKDDARERAAAGVLGARLRPRFRPLAS